MRYGPWVAVLLFLGAVGGVGKASASEMLVTGFTSGGIGRFSLSGAYLGRLDDGGRLDGALCSRVGPDGLLYVTSEANNSVLRFDLATMTYKDTFIPAGRGLNGPSALSWDVNGHLCVANFNTNNVFRYNGTTGLFMNQLVRAGAGPLSGPDNGTTFGPDGSLYVPSFFNNRILKYNGVTGSYIGTVVASIAGPRVMVFRGDSVYVASEGSNAIKRYNATTWAPLADFVPASVGGLNGPVGLVFDNQFAYVTNGNQNRVLKFDALTGAPMGEFIGEGAGGLQFPSFLTIVVPTPGIGMIAGVALTAAVRRRRAGVVDRRPPV
jgi:hypothetical protein